MGASDIVGQVLAETYRVTTLLGEGGMGSVYAAEHVRLPRRFAIKVLHAEALKQREIFGRFRREAEIASSLGHPNIVDVMDFNHMPTGEPYIVMELLEGEELAARITRVGKFPLGAAATILDQTASALAAAHGRGIVHRDLKPANVFLVRKDDRDDWVKIVDFGISKVIESGSLATRTGMIFGTPNYMSPEQATGRVAEVDARTDVFALGAIAYELLAGRMAFESNHPVAVLYAVCHAEPPPLAELRPDLPPAVVEVVRAAMVKDRDARLPSATAFRAALREAAGLSGTTSALTPVSTPPVARAASSPPTTTFRASTGEATRFESTQVRKRGGRLASVAAAIVVAAAAAWLVLGRSPSEIASKPAAPAPTAATLAPPAAPPPPRPSAPPAAMVELRIVTDPPDAELWLDGLRARSPPRAAASSQPRSLSATAPGHKPAERELRFDADAEIRVVLERLPRGGRAPRPAALVSDRPAPAKPAPAKPAPGKKKGLWADEI